MDEVERGPWLDEDDWGFLTALKAMDYRRVASDTPETWAARYFLRAHPERLAELWHLAPIVPDVELFG